MKAKKQLNALTYAIKSYPGIGRTKLMKFVFLVDLFSYNQKGETSLEDNYIRLPNGPVPETGFSLTDMTNPHFMVKKELCDPEITVYQFTPLMDVDLNLFDRSETDLFDTIINSLKSHSANEISQLTHRLALWKNASNGDIIPVDDLKLDEYEYDDLESFIYYTDGMRKAKTLNNNSDSDADSIIHDDFIELQFQTLCGE